MISSFLYERQYFLIQGVKLLSAERVVPWGQTTGRRKYTAASPGGAYGSNVFSILQLYDTNHCTQISKYRQKENYVTPGVFTDVYLDSCG